MENDEKKQAALDWLQEGINEEVKLYLKNRHSDNCFEQEGNEVRAREIEIRLYLMKVLENNN